MGKQTDIYDETVQKLSKLKLDTECVGGGRIQHTPESKFIKVYGYSQERNEKSLSKLQHLLLAYILVVITGKHLFLA
uniref:Uncharacterized protein n=1 Tax=Rhodnius prolixus TaxID=13249 RepID=T1HII2_RHOPR